MSSFKLDPWRWMPARGDVELPEKYEETLKGVRHDALLLELCTLVEALYARVEELECSLPNPPEEEDF